MAGRKPYERISQREYARRLNCSSESIRKAIKAGKINKGWDAKEGKIIFEIANKEWGDLWLSEMNGGESAALEQVRKMPDAMPHKPPPRDAERRKQERKPIEDMSEDEAIDEAEMYSEDGLDMTMKYSEAVRRKEVYKMAREGLAYRKEAGELVNKSEVYRALFGFGQQIRAGVMAMPDRWLDKILTAPNRAEAYQEFQRACHEALTKLSEGETLELTKSNE